jgi:hypothetical protein
MLRKGRNEVIVEYALAEPGPHALFTLNDTVN